MEKFTRLTGIAAPMDAINVDTDQIIPKLHLRTIKRTGLGKVLFDELRFHPDGTEKPEFILNRPPWREAEILVAGDKLLEAAGMSVWTRFAPRISSISKARGMCAVGDSW